jgi:hypothetical protein
VAELDRALDGCPHHRRNLTWDCDDVAVIDVDGSRLVIGWDQRPPGGHAASFGIAIGANGGDAPHRFAHREESVREMILDRIAARHAPDLVERLTTPRVVTPDLLDEIVETLAQPYQGVCAALPDVVATQPPPAAPPGAEPSIGPAGTEAADEDRAPRRRPAPAAPTGADVDRLMARLDEAFGPQPAPGPDAMEERPATPMSDLRRSRAATRDIGARARMRARRAARSAAAVANGVPHIPQLPQADADRIRAALYAPEDAPAPRANGVQRLAVGAMGCTLLSVAAPVGGAVLVYNTLRGADLPMTARAMALTGVALALLDGTAAGALLLKV